MLILPPPASSCFERALEEPGPLARASIGIASASLAAEMFAWSERNPETAAARAFHRPGHEIQRLIATKQPTSEQLEVGVAALREILRVEQEAGGEPDPTEPRLRPDHRGEVRRLSELPAPMLAGSITSASLPTISRARSPSTRRPGMPLAHRETVESRVVEAALLDVGDGHVELLRPLGDDTPVGKYI